MAGLVAVIVAAAIFVLVAAWPGYQELRRTTPVRTHAIALGETTVWQGATVRVSRVRITDATAIDVRGVDDATQQVVAVDLSVEIGAPTAMTSCSARLGITVDDVSVLQQPRVSASTVSCDGTATGPQYSTFVFVIPRGTVEDATVYVQVDTESDTWLAVDVG